MQAEMGALWRCACPFARHLCLLLLLCERGPLTTPTGAFAGVDNLAGSHPAPAEQVRAARLLAFSCMLARIYVRGRVALLMHFPPSKLTALRSTESTHAWQLQFFLLPRWCSRRHRPSILHERCSQRCVSDALRMRAQRCCSRPCLLRSEMYRAATPLRWQR